MSKHFTVSLAIPTYRREAVLVTTILKFLELKPSPDEVLVIDQTKDHEEETRTRLGELHDSKRIIWIKHSPPSLTGARNRTLKESTSDIIIFVDDDVIPSESFVEAHISCYDDPEVVAVAGQVLDKSRETVSLIPENVMRDKRFGWLNIPMNYDSHTTVVSGRGCNFSVRKKTAIAIGGFDERYYGNARREESDFFLRLHRSGGKIVFEPRASLIHLAEPSGGVHVSDRSSPAQTSTIACELYFLLKNYGPFIGWLPLLGHITDFIRRRLRLKRSVVRPDTSETEAIRSYPRVGLRAIPGIIWRVLKGMLRGVYMYLAGSIYIKKGIR